ncbi:MAG: serine hydrolase [Chthonomonadales bacterium]
MRELKQNIERILEPIDGIVSVTVRDYLTADTIGVRPHELLPMASTCKVPVLVAAFREVEAGRLDLEERVIFTEEHRTFGSGLFNSFRDGLNPTIYDCLLMMIVVSDNAATDVLLRKLTPEGVTRMMKELGFNNIQLDRTIQQLIRDILAALDPRYKGIKYGEADALEEANADLKAISKDAIKGRVAVNAVCTDRDIATTDDLARLMDRLVRRELANPESTEAMIKILNTQQLNGRLPRDLPQGTKLPHKTGTLGYGAVVNDIGTLYIEDEPRASIAVLSRDVKNPIHETNTALANVGLALYEYYKNQPTEKNV